MADTPNDRDALVECMARAMWDAAGMRISGLHGPQFKIRWDECERFVKEDWRDNARAALAALESAGLAVVPVEATDAMNRARNVEPCGTGPRGEWRAMLAASPYTPSKE